MFTSVSCTSPGNCVAVGYGQATYIDHGDHPIAAAETNGVWDTYQVGATDVNGEPSVSCPDASDCTAVSGDTSDDAVVFSAAGGSLGAPTVIGSGLLMGVDCIDANDCVAVNNSPGTDLYMVESDGTWAPVPVVDTTDQWLSSVSCTSVSDCTAIGTSGTSVTTNTPSVSVTDNAPIVGHDLTFTATVTGTDAPAPTGTVTWTLGGPGGPSCSSTTGPVSEGNVSTYTCTVTGEPNGSYSATASFGGDAQYVATSGQDLDATVAKAGGTLTLGKNTDLYGNDVMKKIAGSGWSVNEDSSVTLYQCATDSYLSATCDQGTKVAVTLGTGSKAGTFKKAKLRLTVGPMDTRGDTCGLAASGSCYVVAVGSTGDEAASSALAFKPPFATLKSTTSVVPNTSDKVTAASFPAGDTVIAEECDSSVTVPATLASRCDSGTKITGTANAKGKVTFSPPGVTVVDGSSYTESGTGTVSPGGHADIVIDDTTTSDAFVVVPITLHG